MSEIQFDVIRLISDEGGQCDVHELVRRRDKKRFAAKFPKTLHAHLPEVQERFNREVDHYRRIHAFEPHPHVAQMFGIINWGDRKGILLELMETSFGRRLETGITDQEKIQAIRQAAMGLNCLHRHGIAHRDMKPSNLLRAYDGRYVVIDLGCATAAGAVGYNLTRASIGTPDLMAPEQHGPYYQADARSDIYGLGTCVAAAFLGQYPRKLPADEGRGMRIALGPNYDKIDPAFQQLFGRLLHPNSSQRFGSMAAFLESWSDLARRGLLISPAKPPSPLKEALKFLAVGGLIGLGVLAAAAVAKSK